MLENVARGSGQRWGGHERRGRQRTEADARHRVKQNATETLLALTSTARTARLHHAETLIEGFEFATREAFEASGDTGLSDSDVLKNWLEVSSTGVRCFATHDRKLMGRTCQSDGNGRVISRHFTRGI